MPKNTFFFLGFQVDDDLSNRLLKCDESEIEYLQDPEFLERLHVDDNEFIGRRLEKSGIHAENVDDSARNVASMIRRVVPDWEVKPNLAKLMAIEEDVIHDDVVIDNI